MMFFGPQDANIFFPWEKLLNTPFAIYIYNLFMMEIYDGRLWWDGGTSCEARPATKDLQQVLSPLVDIFFLEGMPMGKHTTT